MLGVQRLSMPGSPHPVPGHDLINPHPRQSPRIRWTKSPQPRMERPIFHAASPPTSCPEFVPVCLSACLSVCQESRGRGKLIGMISTGWASSPLCILRLAHRRDDLIRRCDRSRIRIVGPPSGADVSPRLIVGDRGLVLEFSVSGVDMSDSA